MKLIKQAYLISYTIKRDNLLVSDATSSPMKLDKTGQAFYWYSL